MSKTGFDNQLYIEKQSAEIRKRISDLGGKLYLEFGGKLFDDFHASRVLPGFAPDSKIQMLKALADKAEIIIAINAGDIVKNKIRGDLGITYDSDVLRLIDIFRGMDLYVGSVVLTRYNGQPAADAFLKRLTALGIRCYRHYPIAGYPSDVKHIVSDDGLGKNGSRRCAVTGLITGFRSHFLHELGAHVLERILEFDFASHCHTILSDVGSAEFLFYDDVASFGA